MNKSGIRGESHIQRAMDPRTGTKELRASGTAAIVFTLKLKRSSSCIGKNGILLEPIDGLIISGWNRSACLFLDDILAVLGSHHLTWWCRKERPDPPETKA